MLAILRLHPGFVVVLAPVCSGFSFMCSSQAMRFWYDPNGNTSYHWVISGNLMANRVVILAWLCIALGHVFILEQPGSAKFGYMDRFQELCQYFYVLC